MILAFPVLFCSVLVAPAVAAYNHHKWWLAYGNDIDQRLWMQAAHLSTAAMESKFKEHSVVPDVLDDVPPQLAEVVFPNGRCELGNELTPTEVQNPPRISWKAEEGALYTTVMTDPDAPSRWNPKFAQWRHWLVVNIPGTDVTQGETITAYVGAAPPKGTGLHRYVILVYKQPGWLSVDEPRQGLTVKGRNNWSVKEFANKYNLGNPVAANFFQAQWDEYVPKLYEMLG